MGAVTPRRARGPVKPRQPSDFLALWGPRMWKIEPDAVLDFSFRDDAVTITDMRYPSVQRRAVLYTSKEIAEEADSVLGDFEKRARAFMDKG